MQIILFIYLFFPKNIILIQHFLKIIENCKDTKYGEKTGENKEISNEIYFETAHILFF